MTGPCFIVALFIWTMQSILEIIKLLLISRLHAALYNYYYAEHKLATSIVAMYILSRP